MAEGKLQAGITHSGAMRRIGFQHMVVMPARSAKVVHVNQVTVELEQLKDSIARMQLQLALMQQQRDLLEQRLAEFHAAPIDRIDGDPVVPLEAPKLAAINEAPVDTVVSKP